MLGARKSSSLISYIAERRKLQSLVDRSILDFKVYTIQSFNPESSLVLSAKCKRGLKFNGRRCVYQGIYKLYSFFLLWCVTCKMFSGISFSLPQIMNI
jgi:hypothetical protein